MRAPGALRPMTADEASLLSFARALCPQFLDRRRPEPISRQRPARLRADALSSDSASQRAGKHDTARHAVRDLPEASTKVGRRRRSSASRPIPPIPYPPVLLPRGARPTARHHQRLLAAPSGTGRDAANGEVIGQGDPRVRGLHSRRDRLRLHRHTPSGQRQADSNRRLSLPSNWWRGCEACRGALHNPLWRQRTQELKSGRAELKAADELFGGAA
jgi:hypothetical protein